MVYLASFRVSSFTTYFLKRGSQKEPRFFCCRHNSAVEYLVANENVVSSNLITRSNSVTYEAKWNKEKSNRKSKFDSSSTGSYQGANLGTHRRRNRQVRNANLWNDWVIFIRHSTRTIKRYCKALYGRTTVMVRCAALKAVWSRNGFGGSNPSSAASFRNLSANQKNFTCK